MSQVAAQLTTEELYAAFAGPEARRRFPPILGPVALAALVGKSPMAVYHQASREKLKGAVRKRGKRLLIWRDRAIAVIFGQQFRCSPTGSIQLTDGEINAAFDEPTLLEQFPPILSPDRLAKLVGLSRATIYLWLKRGRFGNASHRRGGQLVIWRNRAIQILFNDPEWRM